MRATIKLLLSLTFLLTLSLQVTADNKASSTTQAEEQYDALSSKCQSCPHASACFEAQQSSAPLRSLLWPIPFLLIGLALSYYSKIKYKHLGFMALGVSAILIAQLALAPNNKDTLEDSPSGTAENISDDTFNDDEFAPFDDTSISTNDDEFAPFEDSDISTSDDEFAPFEESNDEFQAFDSEKETLVTGLSERERSLLWYVIPILLITILAGFLSRYRRTRSLRLFFLLASLVYMGFYNGGCPCMISSFQDFVMWLFGADVFWGSMLWFLGLMVITYFFGRVWCSWFCHLGALQEFIYKAKIIKPLKSRKSQRFFIVLRYATLFVLVLQIAITRTNIFIHYDPFKMAFNLFSANTTGYVLLFILLISSLLINRPFCRGFCPVGLAMGWVMRIPGASLLQPNNACITCKSCHNSCDAGAITYDDKVSLINNAECIRCGNCQDACRKSAMVNGYSKGDISFKCEC